MRVWQLALLLVGLALPAAPADSTIKKKNGIIDVPSNYSVDETVDRQFGFFWWRLPTTTLWTDFRSA
jgi:hypothetical protein